MTMNIGNVSANLWDANAILTIRSWSPAEPIYVSSLTADQLGQIRFEMPDGVKGAMQLSDTQIVPIAIVPEASTLIFIPLLAAAALWPEFRGRVLRKKRVPPVS